MAGTIYRLHFREPAPDWGPTATQSGSVNVRARSLLRAVAFATELWPARVWVQVDTALPELEIVEAERPD